jgi:hypothetical protein
LSDPDHTHDTVNHPTDEAHAADALNGQPASERNSQTVREDPYEGAVPPGYDWPTHGGYLGCLIGLMASCLIGGFLGSTLFAALRYWNIVPGVVSALLTVLVFIACTAGLGRIGWVLGRRFYREYPQPGPTWGEVDDKPEAETQAISPTHEETSGGAGMLDPTAAPSISSADDPPRPSMLRAD